MGIAQITEAIQMLDKPSTLLQDSAAPNGETIGGEVRDYDAGVLDGRAANMSGSRLVDAGLMPSDEYARGYAAGYAAAEASQLFQCANNECEWFALPVPQAACDECGAPNVAL